MTTTAHRQERIGVYIPMYNCAPQIPRVIAQFSDRAARVISHVTVIDNQSQDGGIEAATAAMAGLKGVRARVLRNNNNYGLGGSHKVAFDDAIAEGLDYCVVLHGDDQGDIADLLPHIEAGTHRETDCFLGARFAPGSKLVGYDRFRTFGNRVFNLIFSVAVWRRLYDLGAGLNIYSTALLKDRHYRRLTDDLTVNYVHILMLTADQRTYDFFPLTWREDDQLSNVKLFSQAVKTLKTLARFMLGNKSFAAADHSPRGHDADYSATVVYDSDQS